MVFRKRKKIRYRGNILNKLVTTLSSFLVELAKQDRNSWALEIPISIYIYHNTTSDGFLPVTRIKMKFYIPYT